VLEISDISCVSDISDLILGQKKPEVVAVAIVRRPEDIAVAIKEARLRKQLTQAQLAARLKVNRESVHRLEAGEGGVSLKLLLLALHELGLILTLSEDKGIARKTKPGSAISIDEIVDE